MLRKLSEGQRRTITHWAMEFVIVVAGVLLALWLQGEVTQASKHRDAEAAEAAIRAEVDDNLLILVAHDVVVGCQGERLEEIERRLESDGIAAPIPTHWGFKSSLSKHPAVYGFFAMDVADTAWRSAIANGSVSAMDPERFSSIAFIYKAFEKIQRTIDTDREAAKTLQVLSYGTPLTPELRSSLINAYTTASSNRSYLTQAMTARVLAEEMRALGWNDKQRLDSKIHDFMAGMKGYGVELRSCAKSAVNPFGSNEP